MTEDKYHADLQNIIAICAKALPIEVIHRKSGNRNIATTKRHVRSLVKLGELIDGDGSYQAVAKKTLPKQKKKITKTVPPTVNPSPTEDKPMTITTTAASTFVRDEKVKLALESLPSVFEKKTIKHDQPLLSKAIKKQALSTLGQYLCPSIRGLFDEICSDLDSLDLLLTKIKGQ